jgi:hypothetical protein
VGYCTRAATIAASNVVLSRMAAPGNSRLHFRHVVSLGVHFYRPGVCVLVLPDAKPRSDVGTKAPELRNNHSTDEHFRPLLIIAGCAGKTLENIVYPIQGFEYGSLSRRSIQFS